jgi:hypothetical protein
MPLTIHVLNKGYIEPAGIELFASLTIRSPFFFVYRKSQHCYFRNNKDLRLLDCSGICGMSCAVFVRNGGNEHCGI